MSVKDETVPDYTIRANVLATSGTALEQGSKIGLGQTKTVTAMFSNHQVTGTTHIHEGYLYSA